MNSPEQLTSVVAFEENSNNDDESLADSGDNSSQEQDKKVVAGVVKASSDDSTEQLTMSAQNEFDMFSEHLDQSEQDEGLRAPGVDNNTDNFDPFLGF